MMLAYKILVIITFLLVIFILLTINISILFPINNKSFYNLLLKLLFFVIVGVPCVAHTLQLAVLDSLKDFAINNLLNKVRALVRKLHSQTFQYIIKKEKLKIPILDCLTRWNSTLNIC